MVHDAGIDDVTFICATTMRNEAWILPRFLACAALWADSVVLVDDGSTVVTLKFKRKLTVGGYALVWAAHAGTDRQVIRQPIRTAKTVRMTALPSAVAKVVLASPSFPESRDLSGKLGHTTRVVRAASTDQAFAQIGTANSNVRVVVVDIDTYGIALVRDLHKVFPNVRVVAISRHPTLLAHAVKYGAVGVPGPVPPAQLAALIKRLSHS
ncbi:MAG: hypothetical protein WCH31_04635 [Actinomycetes bacterium]